MDAHRPVPGVASLAARHIEQLSDEEFWELARQRASMPSEIPAHEEYLECSLARGICLIPLKYLAEAASPPHRLAMLPVTPRWMSGISVWRGEVIAVIDLHMYLFAGTEPVSPSEGMLLAISLEETTLGFLVPTIGMTRMISAEQVVPPAQSSSLPPPHLVYGVYDEQPIIDIPALFREAIQQIGMDSSHG